MSERGGAMSGGIPLRCFCGAEVKVDPNGKPKRCEKCRTIGMALETRAVFFVRSEGEWVEAETFCEVCRRPLLEEQAVKQFADINLCDKCKWSDEQLAKLRAEQKAGEEAITRGEGP